MRFDLERLFALRETVAGHQGQLAGTGLARNLVRVVRAVEFGYRHIVEFKGVAVGVFDLPLHAESLTDNDFGFAGKAEIRDLWWTGDQTPQPESEPADQGQHQWWEPDGQQCLMCELHRDAAGIAGSYRLRLDLKVAVERRADHAMLGPQLQFRRGHLSRLEFDRGWLKIVFQVAFVILGLEHVQGGGVAVVAQPAFVDGSGASVGLTGPHAQTERMVRQDRPDRVGRAVLAGVLERHDFDDHVSGTGGRFTRAWNVDGQHGGHVRSGIELDAVRRGDPRLWHAIDHDLEVIDQHPQIGERDAQHRRTARLERHFAAFERDTDTGAFRWARRFEFEPEATDGQETAPGEHVGSHPLQAFAL